MKLNGISGEPGTVIGYHKKERRFLAIDEDHSCITKEQDGYCYDGNSVTIRFATSEELTAIGTREPRSVCEHEGIPLRMTPYGPARMFGPRPYVKPRKISKSEARRFLSDLEMTGRSMIIDG